MSVCFRWSLGLSMALLLAMPWSASAQGKIRIAIWEVENHAETGYWFQNDMGPAARNTLDSEFSENKVLSDKFSIVERDKMDLVMKEQGLGQSGALDPQTAAKVGKILGVKYILVGGIDKFDVQTTKGAVGAFGVGGSLAQAQATINIRLIDTTTAERVLSLQGGAEVKKGGGFYKGTSMSRDTEWGLASETIQKASKATVAKFLSGGYLDRLGNAAMPVGGVEGKIIKVDAGRAWINLGASAGLKVGDKFNVFSLGDALIDPDTGVKLGADEKQTGSGAVVDVQPLYAIISLTGSGQAKDTVRKQ